MSRTNAETWLLRDALRDALSPRVPRTAPQLFERVRAEYGHVDERRMWRYIDWLLVRGIAVRLAPRYFNQAKFVDEIDGGVGYLRGTGIEYPWDAADRLWHELAGQGRCPGCHVVIDEARPKWYRSLLCMDCYRASQNEYRLWWRKAAGLNVKEFR